MKETELYYIDEKIVEIAVYKFFFEHNCKVDSGDDLIKTHQTIILASRMIVSKLNNGNKLPFRWLGLAEYYLKEGIIKTKERG